MSEQEKHETEVSCCEASESCQTPAAFERPSRWYRPRIALSERDDDFLLTAEMPGADADRIEVHYEDGTLHLVGRVAARRPEGAKSLIEEYGVGDFYHRLSVGDSINTSAIEAEYNAGILNLRLPKAEDRRPRRIPVSVN